MDLWFHAGPEEIKDANVLNSDECGRRNEGKSIAHAGKYRSDRVSVYLAASADPRLHHGNYSFNGPDAWIYHVEP